MSNYRSFVARRFLVEHGKAKEEFMLDSMGDDDNTARRSTRERRSRTAPIVGHS